ncbi:MAG: sulfotransferase family 2 domain-containing protein [Methylococcales bacterium]
MLISYTHKFMFFHVAKVAGLSIREALKTYAQEPERFRIKRPPRYSGGEPNPLYDMWATGLLHAKARDARKELPELVYDTFYKFAFVRNPWDWQVSMYHFILREASHGRHRLVKSMAGFEEYLEWVIATKTPYARGAAKFQKDMVTDQEGRLIVDFVGRYENFARDFHQVCKVLDIEASAPQLNSTAHADYRSYYNQKTRKMVEEHFQEDIELFGYSFDACHGSASR